MNEALVTLIIQHVRQLGEEQQLELPDDLNGDTALFGQNGLLDSMTLVSLVVGLEQGIEEKFGVAVSLADARAMSQRHSPFRTVGAMAQYAGDLIQEAK